MKVLLENIKKIDPLTAVLFTAINCFFLLLFKHILIRVSLFAICALILFRWGKNPFGDIDPVPFASGIMLVWYGFPVALQYIVWSIPAGDVISGRLNQYSAVNLVALSCALFMAKLIALPVFWVLFLVIVLFNAIRLSINLLMGAGMNAFLSPITHTAIYLILASASSGIISAVSGAVQAI